eukprot:2655747-Pleurochrysis_carterae.AAC.1
MFAGVPLSVRSVQCERVHAERGGARFHWTTCARRRFVACWSRRARCGAVPQERFEPKQCSVHIVVKTFVRNKGECASTVDQLNECENGAHSCRTKRPQFGALRQDSRRVSGTRRVRRFRDLQYERTEFEVGNHDSVNEHVGGVVPPQSEGVSHERVESVS